MDKEKAKKELEKLISEFECRREYYQKTDESNIEKNLIEPLFERVLGWSPYDYEKREKVRRKEGRGISDYAFRIKGRIVFFLEAKAVHIDIGKKEPQRQAISYSLSKRVPFAVLSNFEKMKIFCVEQEDAMRNQFRDLSYKEYLERFDDLWLLSKESFLENKTLSRAVGEQRLKKRVSIDEELLEDMMHIRRLIVNNIEKNYPKKYEPSDKEAIAQRILNRLIFIRHAEDKFINKDKNGKDIELLEEVANLPYDKVYSRLKHVFSKYNDAYDSNLFAIGYDNDADNINLDGSIIKKLVPHLYESRSGELVYNFDWIDADIMGQVYEQYLGFIMEQVKSGMSRLLDGQTHKRKLGAYYTPTFVVDYIVRHTLGEVLKKRNIDASKIQVLDPACGSGSFLIKTFDILDEYYKTKKGYSQRSFGHDGTTYSTKEKVVKNNIYGVDLDRKAAEIAQLNLLLKIAEMGHRLPMLQKNIKSGNTLIDDEKYAEGNPFVWEEKFKTIIEKGGFDVIVGNPPYVRQEELLNIKPHLETHYEVFHSMADLYVYFFEKEMKLLKEGGYFGMVVSNKWLKAGYGEKLRRFLGKYWIEQFINFGDLKVFQGGTSYPCIIIARNIKKKNPKIIACDIKSLDFPSLDEYVDNHKFLVNQENLKDSGWDFYSSKNKKIIDKIKKNSIPLKDYVGNSVYRGILTGFNQAFVIDDKQRKILIEKDTKSSEIIKPFLTGKEVQPYRINFQKKYIILTRIGVDIKRYPAIFEWLEQYKKSLEKRWDKGKYWYELRACDYYEIFKKKKIIYGVITTRPRFAFDNKGYYANNANFFIPSVDKQLLAILNSNLGWFLIKNSCTQVRGGYQLIWKYFGNVPITKNKSEKLESLVDKILDLNNKLDDIGDKLTPEKAEIREEIEEIIKEINMIVFKLYDLNEKEVEYIVESVK